MGLRIPQNQIIKSQYTAGGEYMFANTQNEYQGYYYELNGKKFAGKEFNINNPEIIRINPNNYNKLLGNASTYVYGTLSRIKISGTDRIFSLPVNNSNATLNTKVDFYCCKINQNPLIIKAINEETYISLQKNTLYKTTYVGTYNNIYQSLEDAEKQIPGMISFLSL